MKISGASFSLAPAVVLAMFSISGLPGCSAAQQTRPRLLRGTTAQRREQEQEQEEHDEDFSIRVFSDLSKCLTFDPYIDPHHVQVQECVGEHNDLSTGLSSQMWFYKDSAIQQTVKSATAGPLWWDKGNTDQIEQGLFPAAKSYDFGKGDTTLDTSLEKALCLTYFTEEENNGRLFMAYCVEGEEPVVGISQNWQYNLETHRFHNGDDPSLCIHIAVEEEEKEEEEKGSDAVTYLEVKHCSTLPQEKRTQEDMFAVGHSVLLFDPN